MFPVRIDDAVRNTPEPWARTLRDQRDIGDFTGWKNDDAYKDSFESGARSDYQVIAARRMETRIAANIAAGATAWAPPVSEGVTRSLPHFTTVARHVRFRPQVRKIAATHYLTSWATSRSHRPVYSIIVCERDELIRNGEAERLGSLEVDDQIVLVRPLNRDVRGSASQNLVD